MNSPFSNCAKTLTLILALLYPFFAPADVSGKNPVELSFDLANGSQLTNPLQEITFTAEHPGASEICDTESRTLLVNADDRTAQTTISYNSKKTFSITYTPSVVQPLPQGNVIVELDIPHKNWMRWKWWKKKDLATHAKLNFFVDSIPPQIQQIAPNPGEIISDPLEKLEFSISDTGSGIDESSVQIYIDGNDVTTFSKYDSGRFIYTPTNDNQLPQQDFQARVVVRDKLGNEANVTFDFQVQSKIILSAIPNAVPQTATAPATIRFSPEISTSNAIQTYGWDFDGNGSIDRSDIIGNSYTWQYKIPGEYIVSLTVKDNLGETATGYVIVKILNGPTTIHAEASPSNGEIPLKVTFSVTASDNEGIKLYEWDFEGDNTFDYSSTTTANTSHTYTEAGTYTATLRVTDGQGDITHYKMPTTTVNAAPPGSPTVKASCNISSGVVPLNVTLSATASDPLGKPFILWEWDFDGDGTYDFSNAQSPTIAHIYNRAGIYFPVVRVTTEDNRMSTDAIEIKGTNTLTLSRDIDTINPSLSQVSSITTKLSGLTKVCLVIEDKSMKVVRTLVDWVERTGGSYSDSWDGQKDDMAMAAEGAYYAVLLYEENGEIKRLDLRNSSGGTQYDPPRTDAARSFSPYDNNPMRITYQLPVASEVTAFMGYSYSNTRIVTFLSRQPQGRGSHTILWYGTNNEGVQIYPPAGSYFMFGSWAYRLADNAIYVSSGAHVFDVKAQPPIYDPTTHNEEGKRTASRISFTLTGNATVELSVTDAQTGTRSATQTYPGLKAGANTIEWDGHNKAGEFLAPGKYQIGITAFDKSGYRSLTEYTLQRITY